MSIIFVIILILFLFKLLRDSLYFAWLWQVKEYRIDRIVSYLKEDRNIIKNNLFYIAAVLLFIFLYISRRHDVMSPSGDLLSLIFNSIPYLVLALFIIAFLQILREIKKRSFLRPKPTLKILLLFSITAIFYCLLFAIYWIPPEFISGEMTMIDIGTIIFSKETKFPAGNLVSGIGLALLIYIINPFVISAIILCLNPFFNFQKRRIIKKATEKMAGLKKVKVIGITGSYGKTSTKEFLYAILGQKYKVVKTEGNNNTNIGIAYTVLNKVSDDYDYFICEMGAYKIGEIAEICGIVKPEIGILTGINQQHIDLFGSQENIIKGKFELIEALPENGLAIINGDNEHIKKEIEKRSEGFSPTIRFFRAKALAPSVKVFPDYVEFDFPTTSDCHSGEVTTKNAADMREEQNNGIITLSSVAHNDKWDETVKFKLNLPGKHYIENVLSAIITAEEAGMNLEEIKKAVAKIKPTEYMMRKLNGPNDSIFIDDSYSANPDGVIAALDYLEEAYAGYKKIIVFPGIIELGNKSEEVHLKLFDKIGKVCDIAYILENQKSKIKNQNENIKCKFIFKESFDEVAKMLKSNLDNKNVVLFESRGAGAVMGKLI